MDFEKEINSLAAETLALQYILTQALYRLSKVSPEANRAISAAFDDASSIASTTAISMGTASSPDHAAKAVRVVEELRAVVFTGKVQPKRDT